ncbi:NUDIX domain-containing protein [Halosimplex halophilum]|uniref:NUDIX domain-containing protein n=1 Tax=Halosimplex halophilum TaxID=2559572 RepID=UPI00107F1828|nr:NUDIX domain-containing protein [Halosimplex halophilum]
MSWRDIRPVAVGVPRREDEVLLSRLHDSDGTETFYRPIGGGIEFGESSDEALAREFEEELDVEVVEADLLETLENTFTFEGRRGHEIWFLYDVTLAESWPYERDEFDGREPEADETYRAVWTPVDALDDVTVYPEHLASLL